jgi:hypothetical protein
LRLRRRAPAGRHAKFHGVIAGPPIPIDQQSLVALFFLPSGSYFGDGKAVIDGGRWQHSALFWPATTIGGGTPNVQKNIIAKRMLGLPKD